MIQVISKPVRKRRSFSSKSPNMPLPKIDGYVTRWFNDEENRIHRATAGGWEFVTPEEFRDYEPSHVEAPNSDLGTRVSVLGGTDDHGAPIRVYLMKIMKEFWEEDMAAKRESINETDKAIHAGNVSPYAGGYVKNISITTS